MNINFEREKIMSQEITLQELQSAKSSVFGRLKRLRKIPTYRRGSRKSPISKIAAFADDIDKMEEILKNMENRLDNAKITIEI